MSDLSSTRVLRISLTLLSLLLLLPLTSWAGDVEIQLGAGDGFVVKDNTGTIERLRVAEATGNVSRNGALFVHTTGSNNTFVGEGAGTPAYSGSTLNNSAFGKNALGGLYAPSGDNNSAFGRNALTSNIASNNSAFGSGALPYNGGGQNNSAFGALALEGSIGGDDNSAFGFRALNNNYYGSQNSAFGANAGGVGGARNSAFGFGALLGNYLESDNSAFGSGALTNSIYGFNNSAFGSDALRENSYGYNNSAFGDSALLNNGVGYRNVAIGANAGSNQTSGGKNIYISNTGVAAESGKIKIGNSAHTETFIEGIDGNTAVGGVTVLVNSSNELHTLVSSLRFKEAVRDIADSSEVLMKLRPVSFLYRDTGTDSATEGEDRAREYGLIAEEVAELAPELVVRDTEGKPYSVRYHVLPALLLNEIQKQERAITALIDRLEDVEVALKAAREGPDR